MQALKLNQVENQANQLVAEARKKLSPKGFFQNLFGLHRNRFEDAIDCYQRAGNLYKLTKNWPQAATVFKIAAELHLDYGNRVEAAHDFVLAAKCLQNYDSSMAIELLGGAIEIYTDLGRFIMSAKLHYLIAELYEDNLIMDAAIRHFEQAADFFQMEDGYNSAKKCLLKVAQYASSDFYDYEKALAIYEKIALNDIRDPIGKYGAKDHFLKALLCHLAIDSYNAKLAMERYLERYPLFAITKEYEFVFKLIDACEEGSIDNFEKIVANYDEIVQIHCWYQKLLVRIKNQLDKQPDLL